MIETVLVPTLCYATAARLVAAALAHAEAQGWRVAAAVCDASGTLLAFGRMDGVPAPVADYAIDKAWTSATHHRSTEGFGARMLSDPALALGLGNRPRALAWQGGVPVLAEGQVVGGLGVSGAAGPEDAACAVAALAACGGQDESR